MEPISPVANRKESLDVLGSFFPTARFLHMNLSSSVGAYNGEIIVPILCLHTPGCKVYSYAKMI